MDTIPHRTKIAGPYRYVLKVLEPYIALPWQNPNVYSVLSVIGSIPFLFLESVPLRLVLLSIVLLLDWMDGAAARKYKRASKNGYIIDVVFDRLSDIIILASTVGTFIGNILFFICLFNNLLVYYSLKTGKHYVLAARFFYWVVLLLQLLNFQFSVFNFH